MSSPVPWTTIVLAAGFGERLAPLTDSIPKPLIPIAGLPLVEHLVRRIGACGLPDPIVVVNHRDPDQWAAWQARTVARGATVLDNGVVHAAARHGAIADLRASMRLARERVTEGPWLVVAGDNLVAAQDLAQMTRAWSANGRPQVGCRDLGASPGSQFGEVTLGKAAQGEGMRIVGFREKPEHPRSSIAATCTYVLAPDAPDAIDAYLAGGGDADSPGRFIAWLSQQRRVDAHLLVGDYHDIGTPETLAGARMAMGDPGEPR